MCHRPVCMQNMQRQNLESTFQEIFLTVSVFVKRVKCVGLIDDLSSRDLNDIEKVKFSTLPLVYPLVSLHSCPFVKVPQSGEQHRGRQEPAAAD